MRIKRSYLTYVPVLLLLLQGCAQTPVVASCPPFPMPPAVVTSYGLKPSASSETNLMQEYEEAFNALLNDLQKSFNEAQSGQRVSTPVQPGL